jgi:hypothetical protein
MILAKSPEIARSYANLPPYDRRFLSIERKFELTAHEGATIAIHRDLLTSNRIDAAVKLLPQLQGRGPWTFRSNRMTGEQRNVLRPVLQAMSFKTYEAGRVDIYPVLEFSVINDTQGTQEISAPLVKLPDDAKGPDSMLPPIVDPRLRNPFEEPPSMAYGTVFTGNWSRKNQLTSMKFAIDHILAFHNHHQELWRQAVTKHVQQSIGIANLEQVKRWEEWPPEVQQRILEGIKNGNRRLDVGQKSNLEQWLKSSRFDQARLTLHVSTTRRIGEKRYLIGAFNLADIASID